MLVAITQFGSIWRHRVAKTEDPMRFARAVYYNTTGVEVNGAIRQRPQIEGYACFYVCGGFNPNWPLRMIGCVFDCADPCVWSGHNHILFRRRVKHYTRPTAYLVVAGTNSTGRLKIGEGDWRSQDSWLISVSESKKRQEAMLLMPAHSWIWTEVGKFVLLPSSSELAMANLVLQ